MELMTKTEVASLLRVSPRTVQNYISVGMLPPPAKLGRRLLWLRSDIEFVLRSSRQPTAQQSATSKAPRVRHIDPKNSDFRPPAE
ncbi:MAG: helix-turn-helix domain-containing protein, partial [Anaerolineae bacterium]|nr:helix-turn-helix domain-containing protein [Anaerolineae bacterium]